jgi:hypothetical protein
MAIQSTSPAPFSTINSIEVPESANFIGGIEDALVFQSLVLNATTDRLRESIMRNLGPAGDSIAKIEALSSTLEMLASFTQSSQLPITYGALQAADKTSISLRSLFAKDGPNLGDSLEKSQSALAKLATDGVRLDAPKMTPVMTEQFTAVGGKVDFSKLPSATLVGWRTEQEVTAIDPGSAPGDFPGSVVKTIESRDSGGKLVSVTRYTVFIDYSNLRPKEADLNKEFLSYIEKIRSTLDDLILRLADTLKSESVLNQRVSEESIRIKDDQKKFFDKEQEKVISTFESIRLFRIFYLEINGLRNLFEQKVIADNSSDNKNTVANMVGSAVIEMIDPYLLKTNNLTNRVVSADKEIIEPYLLRELERKNSSKFINNIPPDKKILDGKNNIENLVSPENFGLIESFLPQELETRNSSNLTKTFAPDVAGLSDFRADVSSLKSLLSTLNKAASTLS